MHSSSTLLATLAQCHQLLLRVTALLLQQQLNRQQLWQQQ
jgi:hypothetical protein